MTFKSFESHAVSDLTEHSTLWVKNILVPLDFSSASKRALKYALRLAEKFSAELTLLYVVAPAPSQNFIAAAPETSPRERDFTGAEKNLRALIASDQNGNAGHARCIIRAGVPSQEIIQAAKEADVDLIVIATHGYTGWKHFCIGSTAERVVRAASCPVLVVREKEHEFT